MVERKIGDKVIRLVRGDITDLEVEAFVFDIGPDCKLESGYGGAIAQRGGKVVQEALDEIGSLATGKAVLTTSGKMKAKNIIHTNGPKFHESDTKGKLTSAMEATLAVAEENGFSQIAYTPIGTGLYQVPMDLSIKTMIAAAEKHLKGKGKVKEVLFVALDSREYNPLKAELEGGG